MTENCCNLVGSFGGSSYDSNLGIISISSNGGTPVQLITSGGESALTVEPSTGTLSISAYAGTETHYGCSGRAGVNVKWISRSDCEEIHYLFGGGGKSYIQGDIGGYVKFPEITGVGNPVADYKIVDASASSGPAVLYTDTTQYDGFGMVYTGSPWGLDTTTEKGCTIDMGSYGIGGYGQCILQSFTLTCTPASIPVINLNFIYKIPN